MSDGKDQRKDRNELQKLLRILAKQKIRSKSSSSSEQQTNTSSDESSDILTDGKSDQENDSAKGELEHIPLNGGSVRARDFGFCLSFEIRTSWWI